MDIAEILQHDEKFRYQLLDRMRMDCEYYLNYGRRNPKNLWAGDEEEHIKYMKAIWKSFPKNKKPQWLKYGQILEYRKLMVTQHEQRN